MSRTLPIILFLLVLVVVAAPARAGSEPKSSFSRQFALGGYATGLEGAYGGGGVGGRAHWRMASWVELDLFADALIIESPAGLRHDHPIGFNLFFPIELSSHTRLRPLIGMCAVLSMIEPDQDHAPRADDVFCRRPRWSRRRSGLGPALVVVCRHQGHHVSRPRHERQWNGRAASMATCAPTPCSRRPVDSRFTLIWARSSGWLVVLAVGVACNQDEPHDFGPDSCQSCHPMQQAEWRTARHSQPADSPVFVALLPEVEQAWGPGARARCMSCHEPGHGGEASIGCMTCHSAVGNRAPRDGALVVDVTVPIAGPFGDTMAPHPTRSGELLTSPVLCGTCHEVTGPNLFDEPTLTDFLASPAGQQGETCASCHMPRMPDDLIAVSADIPRPRASHEFVGVDPAWGATVDVQDKVEQATRELLESSFEVRIVPLAGKAI